MTQAKDDETRAHLLKETAKINWQELQPWFAKGHLVWVAQDQDLVESALAMIKDDKSRIEQLASSNKLTRVNDEQARDFADRQPEFWAVVIAPWVLVQEATDRSS